MKLDNAGLKKDFLKWLDKQTNTYDSKWESIDMKCESEQDRELVSQNYNVFKFAALEEHLANKIIQAIDGSNPK